MKKKILSLCLALLVLYCLLFPQRMAQSAANGLTLWYHSVLPTLLPFCIFSNIIVQSGIYDQAFEKLYPFFRYIYPVRAPLIYPMSAGFLFGFPLGSKICADLYQAGKISSKEAEFVSCISNNFGPAFLHNYVLLGLFKGSIPALPFFLCCYAPPMLLGRLFLALSPRSQYQKNTKKPAPGSHISMKILDAGIMDGFTTMLKLAGYILLSALLADLLKLIPFTNDLISCLCTGIMEITNGIHQILLLKSSTCMKLMLAAGMINFGGISGIMQTWAMLKSTKAKISHYILFKILCSIAGILMTAALFSGKH